MSVRWQKNRIQEYNSGSARFVSDEGVKALINFLLLTDAVRRLAACEYLGEFNL